MDWQLIETAPKTREQILTYLEMPGNELVFNRKFWFQASFWSEEYGRWVGWPKEKQPTHWCKLEKP